MQVRCKDIITAITFEELVAHGLAQPGASIVDGVPWSFSYMGWPVTHEDDDTYIVTQPEGYGARFERGAMLLVDEDNGPVPVPMEEFRAHFEPATPHTVAFPKRQVTFTFSHETMGDERVGDRFEVAFAEYNAAMRGVEEWNYGFDGSPRPAFDWKDFTASNGVRIQATAAEQTHPDDDLPVLKSDQPDLLAPIPPAEILNDLTPEERAALEVWTVYRMTHGWRAEQGDHTVFVPMDGLTLDDALEVMTDTLRKGEIIGPNDKPTFKFVEQA